MFKKDPSKFQGHVELARVLLEHGADVNAQDNENNTMLYWESESEWRKRRRGCLASGQCERLEIKNRLDPSRWWRRCSRLPRSQARGTASNLSFKSVDDLFEDIVHLLRLSGR